MPDDSNGHLAFGLAGEQLAEQFLVARGLRPMVRRFTTPVGELDLVLREGDTIVFVEVKTRRDRRFADPEDAVNSNKRRRLIRAAQWFIHDRRLDAYPCRFDIVTVIRSGDGPAQIEHYADAFVPRD